VLGRPMQRQELSGLDGGPIVVESELTDEKASAVLRGLVACGLISPAAGPESDEGRAA